MLAQRLALSEMRWSVELGADHWCLGLWRKLQAPLSVARDRQDSEIRIAQAGGDAASGQRHR